MNIRILAGAIFLTMSSDTYAFEPERIVPSEEEIQAFTDRPSTPESSQALHATAQQQSVRDWLSQRSSELSARYHATIVLRDLDLDPQTGIYVTYGHYNGRPIKAYFSNRRFTKLEFVSRPRTIAEEEEG